MTDLNKRTDLLEREADLEQIGGALRSAAAGSCGIVVIEGEPGIGKTSLLEEAAELAEAGWMSILRGYAHNQASAYDVAAGGAHTLPMREWVWAPCRWPGTPAQWRQ